MSTENVPGADHRTTAPGIPTQGPPPPLPVAPATVPAPAGAPGPWRPDGGTVGWPASIGDRLLARIIDGGVIIAGFFVFGGLGNVLTDSAPTLAVVPSLIAFAIYFGYEFAAIGLFGQTLGKHVMKLRVVAVDGGPAGWGASAGRVYIPMVASFLTCGLGSILFYLSPLFDGGPWKRGWYDQLASTVVISTKQPWRPG